MNNAIGKLCNGLERKRFLPIECEGMIEDIIDFINTEKYPSITTLNQELEDLGWGIGVFDDDLYALTISLLGSSSRNKTPKGIRLNTDNEAQDPSPSLLEKAVA